MKPRYTALSYCWGDATSLSPIYVNNKVLGITGNLHAALYYMRSPSQLRTFWVDSICINQSDKSEKSRQVAIMKEIFEGAEKVMAWLGEPMRSKEQDQEPIEYHSHVHQPVESDCLDYQAMRYISSRIWSETRYVTASEDVLQTLGSLFSSPILDARLDCPRNSTWKEVNFYCGHESFGLGVLQEFLTKKLPPYHSLRSALWNPRRLLRLALSPRETSDILLILREAVPFQASVLVDKIFALRALFPSKLANAIKPEYEKPFQDLTA